MNTAKSTSKSNRPPVFPGWITPIKQWDKPFQGLIQKDEVTTPKEANRVLQIFLNCDLRCAHDGLSEIARRQGIDVRTLNRGHYLCFLNAAKDRLKMFASGNIVAYLKAPKGSRIDLRLLCEIPKAFNGVSIDHDAALKEALRKIFARRGKSFPADEP